MSLAAWVYYAITCELALLFGALTRDIPHQKLACIGRWVGRRQVAKLQQAEAMAELQLTMVLSYYRRDSYGHGTVLTGICRTCGLKVPGGGHRADCRGLLNEQLLRARRTPAAGPRPSP